MSERRGAPCIFESRQMRARPLASGVRFNVLLHRLQVLEAINLTVESATGYRVVKEFMERAGTEGGMASPKELRHSVTTACIAEQIPLMTIRKWMGMRGLETTAIYLEVSGNEERRLA